MARTSRLDADGALSRFTQCANKNGAFMDIGWCAVRFQVSVALERGLAPVAGACSHRLSLTLAAVARWYRASGGSGSVGEWVGRMLRRLGALSRRA